MEQRTSSKLGKEYVKAVSCHPVYLTYFYAEYIMSKAGLDKSQAGIKIVGRNINISSINYINNLKYTDDTTLMAESEEELNSLLMRVKEENGKAGLKLGIQKTKIMAPGSITSWKIKIGKIRSSFFELKNHCGWWMQPWI